jgi:ATP-dependent protease HslVU (ClpYQ) peptidase subunit
VCAGSHREGYGVKIAKRGPVLAGASGNYVFALKFLDWFRDGLPLLAPRMAKDANNYATGVLFLPDDRILSFNDDGWTAVGTRFYAIGSGCEYAYGAMAMGATAEEAVRAAMRFDIYTGGEIQVMKSGGRD